MPFCACGGVQHPGSAARLGCELVCLADAGGRDRIEQSAGGGVRRRILLAELCQAPRHQRQLLGLQLWHVRHELLRQLL